MADYTTDSPVTLVAISIAPGLILGSVAITCDPATLVCATLYAPVVATITGVRQEGGMTFIDVTYVAQTGETCSVAQRVAEGATAEEIQTEIKAYGTQWYMALRWQVADAGAWHTGLTSLIDTRCIPEFPPVI